MGVENQYLEHGFPSPPLLSNALSPLRLASDHSRLRLNNSQSPRKRPPNNWTRVTMQPTGSTSNRSAVFTVLEIQQIMLSTQKASSGLRSNARTPLRTI